MKKILLVSMITALVGCGSDHGDMAKLTLNLTDAPVAGVSEVNIHINSIELKKNSETFNFDVDQSVNLLDLQGSASLTLLDGISVPAGQYQYIRLDLEELNNTLLLSSGAEVSFDIPSEAQSGLKLNSPFMLSANGNANFTLDFDVAKSLSLSNQGYKMRPTIRIVDNSEIGHIAGSVAAELISNCETMMAVYAFEGTEFSEQTETTGPVTSSVVAYNEETNTYGYELGFLEAGDYRLDLVCGEDDPTANDELTSTQTATATVESKSTSTVDFEIEL